MMTSPGANGRCSSRVPSLPALNPPYSNGSPRPRPGRGGRMFFNASRCSAVSSLRIPASVRAWITRSSIIAFDCPAASARTASSSNVPDSTRRGCSRPPCASAPRRAARRCAPRREASSPARSAPVSGPGRRSGGRDPGRHGRAAEAEAEAAAAARRRADRCLPRIAAADAAAVAVSSAAPTTSSENEQPEVTLFHGPSSCRHRGRQPLGACSRAVEYTIERPT